MATQIDPQTGERIPAGPAPQIDPATGERIAASSPAPQKSLLSTVGEGAKNLGLGALKGVDSTISSADNFSRKHLPAFMTNTGMGFGKPANLEQQKTAQAPQGGMQSLGKGLEQAGEFLVPGAAEEAAAAKAGKFAPAAKMGYSALTSGALNKAQGGDFKTGALAGGIGSGISEGLSALAPKVAESAVGITKADRGFGKSPGEAILKDTKGIRPESVAESAQQKISQLSPQVEGLASGSPATPDLTPARQVVGRAINKATARNAASTAGQLDPMSKFLTERFDTGASIPATPTASDFLNLRRGFNDEFGQWNPDTLPGVAGTGRQAYHALTDEFHNAVPETKDLDSRISNLIPVVKRAESTSRNAPLIQRSLGRFGAHTGALTGAALGATEGKREGGLGGMVVGGTAGLLAPELIATPEGRMIMARTMGSPAARNLLGAPLKGGLLQMDRGAQK